MSVTCPKCGETRQTAEPCITCYGSTKPGSRNCGTCFSFEYGYCRRIEDKVYAKWKGCMLHVPNDYLTRDKTTQQHTTHNTHHENQD